MSAKNCWFASLTCLYNNPLMCVNKSASCLGAFSSDNHLEMHLQNGSVFCILSRALCWLAGRDFGVKCWGVKSGGTVSWRVGVFEKLLFMGVWQWCDVLLLVLNAEPSGFMAVDILMVALLLVGSSTNLEDSQQLCFLLLIFIQTWYCRLQVPVPICWFCYWCSFHSGIWLSGLRLWWTMMFSPRRQ